MNEFFTTKPELFWFILGLVLLLMELVLPGFVIFFFGVGAWITALVCLISNPGINLQVIIFTITSVLALLVFRNMIQNKFIYNKDDRSGEVEDEFTGKEAVAVDDFGVDRTGKVEFKGTSWKAESKSEITAGQKVIILEKDSFKLKVEPKK
ncbi:MAG TPA: NfeD family protein [Bacteroidales bacterium]|jgi:membrane protein implicated in regulation of membrane protease activity|nr:NfeD family protein [Bacteroidales bacterium]HQM69512.1 NfeD family protein [Bacteroidales bacterium]